MSARGTHELFETGAIEIRLPCMGLPLRFARSGVCVVALALACGSDAAGQRNRTFYDWSLGDGAVAAFERPEPRLNWPSDQVEPDFIGVEVLRGAVRFSHPRNWIIRDASNEPGAAFVHYVSPRAYAFALYERHAEEHDDWSEILARYEAEVKKAGARIVGQDVPMATTRGQGRAYSLQTDVEAPGGALTSHSREMLIRGDLRLVLVQIVHHGEIPRRDEAELLRAVGTLEVH